MASEESSFAPAVHEDLTRKTLNPRTLQQFAEFCEDLKSNTYLTDLTLQLTGDVEYVRLLREALILNTTLVHLSLRACSLDPDCARELAEVLKVNSTLQHLGSLFLFSSFLESFPLGFVRNIEFALFVTLIFFSVSHSNAFNVSDTALTSSQT
eukprot:m.137938 g.137938  ORF g.137938 m.137938 type:complete len:153 (+) comp14912_c0_seq5:23-481(+)